MGGIGSNQHQTKPGGKTSEEVIADGDVGASPVDADPFAADGPAEPVSASRQERHRADEDAAIARAERAEAETARLVEGIQTFCASVDGWRPYYTFDIGEAFPADMVKDEVSDLRDLLLRRS